MNLSVIIVDYKSKDKTINCLKSITETTPDDIKYEVIIVNNGSDYKDEERRIFFNTANELGAIIVESEKNLGMGQGNNFGLKHARGEYLLILNADTILKKMAIAKMIGYLKANQATGIVGPKLLYPDGELQYSCFREPSLITPLYRRTFLGRLNKKHLDRFMISDFDRSHTRSVDWIMGSCMLLRKNLMDELGGFDDRFFMYFEDTDLCRRVREKGLEVVFYHEAEVVHDHGRGSATNDWYIAPFTNGLAREHIKSWLKYFIKHKKPYAKN